MRTPTRRRLPRTSTALLAALLVFSSMSLANDTTAEATTAFSPRVNETLNGGMITIGNAVIECDPAQDPSGNCVKSHTAQGFQNDLPMKHTRVDARFSTNSSTSDLRLPAGATVRHAYLYWTGTTVTAGIDRVKWAPPGATALETLSPTATVNSASPYVYVADVTAQVRAAGDGTYVVGDIVTTTGNQQTAGWVLAVVYEAPGEALRNVSLFDGFVDVSPNTSPEVSISGFKTPPIGDVHSSVTVVATEGDGGITGDKLSIKAGTAAGFTDLTDSCSPATNFFNFSVCTHGTPVTSRNPAYVSNLTFDIDEVLVPPGVIPNDSTSATLRLSTAGDNFQVFLLGFVTEVYAPQFRPGSPGLTVTPSNPGVGDTFRYVGLVEITGAIPAEGSSLSVPLPADVEFVPGSIEVGTTKVTDAPGDDTGEYVASSRTVAVRIGTGADASSGGTVADGSPVPVSFQARPLAASSGESRSTVATFSYDSPAAGLTGLTSRSQAATITVRAEADLSIGTPTFPTSFSAGTDAALSYPVANTGPAAASSAKLDVTLPDGFSLVSGSGPGGACTGSGSPLQVTCPIGTVASGGSATVDLTVRPAPDLPNSTTLLGTDAAVSSTTFDPNGSNNAVTVRKYLYALADLDVGKVLANGPIRPGSPLQYTITVTNTGPALARSVTVLDLPGVGSDSPLRVTAMTPSSGTCDLASLSCDVGDLAPGGSATVAVTASLPPGFTGTVANLGFARSSTADPDGSNSVSTSTETAEPLADVTVTGPARTSAPGVAVPFEATVSNSGPSTAKTVLFTALSVPAALNLTGLSSTVGTCTLGPPVGCTIGDLAPGAAARITFSVSPSASAPEGPTPVSVQVATATAQPPGGGDPDAATLDFALTKSSDLRVSGSVIPSPLVAGGPYSFFVSVDNDGPSDSRAATLTLTYPDADLDPPTTLSASDGGSCAAGPAGTVECSWASVPAGGSRTATISGEVKATAAAPLPDASVSVSTTSDPFPSNDSATLPLSVTAESDVSVSASWSPGSIAAGSGSATLSLSATNAGPSNAADVVVSTAVPAGFVPAAVPGGCTFSAPDLSCTAATLAPGGTAGPFVWTFPIPADQPAGQITTVATVGSSTHDADGTNNTLAVPFAVTRSAGLAASFVASPPSVVPGTDAAFTVRIDNAGPSTAEGAHLHVVLSTGAASLVATTAPCTLAADQLQCDLGTLPVGATDVSFTLGIPAGFPDATLDLAADATSTTPGTPGADSASVPATPQADLGFVPVTPPAEAVRGAQTTWDLTITNGGPSDVTDAVVEVTVPLASTPDLTVDSVDSPAGACAPTAADTWECPALPLGVNGSARVRVAGTLAPDATATQVVVNALVASASTPEPTGAVLPDSASITTPVTSSATLEIVKAGLDEVPAGSIALYLIAVANAGPSLAEGVVVTDVVPAEIGSVAAEPAAQCSVAANTVTCDFGDLLPTDPAPFVLVGGIVDQAQDPVDVVNAAAATSSTPLTGPAESSFTTRIVREADLIVTSPPLSTGIVAGGTGTIPVVVVNHGISPATDTVVSATLPAGVTILSAATSAGTCSGAGTSALQCPLGAVPPGGTATIDVAVAVPAGFPQGFNTLEVDVAATTTAQLLDPATASTVAYESVSGSADLSVTAPTVVRAPHGNTLEVSWSNAGPSDVPEAVLRVAVPATMDALGWDVTPGFTCSADPVSHDVTCRGPHPAGATGTLQLRLTNGEGRVTVTVDATVLDPDRSNNEAGYLACDGLAATIVAPAGGGTVDGTRLDDVIYGSPGDDVISGFGGDDLICGLGGDDVLLGGPGDDTLIGGNGKDKLRGASGDDTLDGGAATDRLLPETGADTVDGGTGLDIVDYRSADGPVSVNLERGTATYRPAGAAVSVAALTAVERVDGTPFDDTLIGTIGTNVLRGKQGDDLIAGKGGDDTLVGGLGEDEIRGASSNDTLKGQAGDDWLLGQGGDDQLVGGAGNDLLWGGPGDDTLIGGLKANLATETNRLNGGDGTDACRWDPITFDCE